MGGRAVSYGLRPQAALEGNQASPHTLTSRLLGGLWRSLLSGAEGKGLLPGRCVLLHQTLHTLLASRQPSRSRPRCPKSIC